MPLIDPLRLRPLLGSALGRFDVDSLDVCDSTNSELARRADAGAPAGTVIVADRQEAGRGRRGRRWLASPESGLTFSLLWRFSGPATRLAGLSLAVGLAVAEGLEALGAQGVGLKWPNDLLLARPDGFAKLGGILVELSSDRRGTQAIIGIGLNLLPPDLPPDTPLSQAAGGLSEALPSLPERHGVLAEILLALAHRLPQFDEAGFAALQADWQSRHAWQGRPVALIEEGRVIGEGLCLGADADGSLRVQTAQGEARHFAGDLSLRLP